MFRLFSLLAVCVLAGCQTMPSPTAMAPQPKQMEVNGVKLTYVEQGKGVPVVFVHGAISDYRTWERQREAFPRRYRYIALTQRYFGTDPWLDNGAKFSVATHADDLSAFIRQLKGGPVNLVGWSYSGQILFAVALQHPELVSSLFVFEPAHDTFVTDPASKKAVGEDAGATFGPTAEAIKAGDNAAGARKLLEGVNEEPGVLDSYPPALRAVVLDNARTLPVLFAQPPSPPITCAQLGQIKVPVAIVRGELARPFFKIIADTASRCIPGSQLVVVPKGRHLWPGQEPAAFNAALLGFLDKR